MLGPEQLDAWDALARKQMKGRAPEDLVRDTPEGIQLKQAAVDRIRKASDTVRKDQGHCSVWKSISHRDGRAITDLTAAVRLRLQQEDDR